jgi:hypothetical protein
MIQAIVDLLKSKRFVVLVGSGISLIAVRLGLGLEDGVAEKLAEQVTILAATAIGGISLSDAAKAVMLPPGQGHKDQA